jgi:hypothetical protein
MGNIMRKNIGLVKAKTASPQSFVTNTGEVGIYEYKRIQTVKL